MKLFRSAQPAQPELAPAREVRIFQSETAEILEGPQPVEAHLTVLILAGMFVSILLIACFMRVDRVVSSTSGQMVTVEPTIVLGALDQSIIKTIDVGEGER
jgi:HlyD family secretion protein